MDIYGFFVKKYKNWRLVDICMICALTFLGVITRAFLYPFESADYLYCFEPWTDQMAEGGLHILGEGFARIEYPPIYMLFLFVLTNTPIPVLYGIKIFSTVFDIAMAGVGTLFFEDNKKKIITYGIIIFLPTAIWNSSFWGQCDSIYTTFLLASLYCMTKINKDERYAFWSVFWISVAFCFKLQSVFLLPLVCYFMMKSKIKIYYLGMIPAMYLLTCIPALSQGRSLLELIGIYFYQAQALTDLLTLGFPNIYAITSNIFVQWFVGLGIVLTFVLLLLLLYYCYDKRIENNTKIIVLMAFTISNIMNFFLPRMHERYGFFADVVGVLWGVYKPKRLALAVVLICSSFLAYMRQFTVINIPMEILAFLRGICMIIVGIDLYNEIHVEENRYEKDKG